MDRSSSSPTLAVTPWLDGKHTVFGEVLGAEDQKIVDSIRQGDKIESITIVGDTSALFADPKVQLQVEQWKKALAAR